MKNTLYLLIFVFTSSALYAQKQKHELNFGMGGLSRSFSKVGMKFKTLYGAGGHEVKSHGVYHIGYQYHVRPTISIGITFVYEYLKHELSPGSSHPRDDWKRKIYTDKQYTTLASIHKSWFKNEWITLHFAAAAGLNVTDREETRNDFGGEGIYDKFHFAYQITPIGIKVGKQLFGYAELGYGFKGIVCGGVGIRF